MTRNSKSSSGSSADAAEQESSDPAADAPAGTDQWAQAVVDGMPAADAADDVGDVGDLLDGTPTGEIPASDLAAAAEAAGPIPESWFADSDDDDGNAEDGTEVADDGGDDDVVDAEIVEDDDVDHEDDADDGVDNDAVDAGTTAPPPAAADAAADISVEDLVLDLERVTTERDQYLDASRRLQAEFENYKKQVSKRESEARERANDSLIGELLPVLDAFDGALANGAEDVAPMRTSFLDAMAKQGLERIDPEEVAFDPHLHEAVMHEDADDVDGPVVAEVMRAGYVWKGRVLRPAMVRTRG